MNTNFSTPTSTQASHSLIKSNSIYLASYWFLVCTIFLYQSVHIYLNLFIFILVYIYLNLFISNNLAFILFLSISGCSVNKVLFVHSVHSHLFFLFYLLWLTISHSFSTNLSDVFPFYSNEIHFDHFYLFSIVR